MALNKNLAKLFDVEPTKPESSKNLIGGTFNSNNFGKDYEMVQNNLKDLIQNGNIALESALKVATESDSPRAFEVVAIILKTMAQSMGKKEKRIDKEIFLLRNLPKEYKLGKKETSLGTLIDVSIKVIFYY